LSREFKVFAMLIIFVCIEFKESKQIINTKEEIRAQRKYPKLEKIAE